MTSSPRGRAFPRRALAFAGARGRVLRVRCRHRNPLDHAVTSQYAGTRCVSGHGPSRGTAVATAVSARSPMHPSSLPRIAREPPSERADADGRRGDAGDGQRCGPDVGEPPRTDGAARPPGEQAEHEPGHERSPSRRPRSGTTTQPHGHARRARPRTIRRAVRPAPARRRRTPSSTGTSSQSTPNSGAALGSAPSSGMPGTGPSSVPPGATACRCRARSPGRASTPRAHTTRFGRSASSSDDEGDAAVDARAERLRRARRSSRSRA